MDKYKDPDWLEEQYWKKGKSLQTIADEANVSSVTIQYWIHTQNVGVRNDPRGRPRIPIEDLLDDIIAGRVYLGYWPKGPDYYELGEYSDMTLCMRFGSYSNALEAAKERYEETKDEWPTHELEA